MSDEDTDLPAVASTTPFPVEVQAGRTYYWCACGRSAKQPFCDGSHAGTDITPLPWTADRDRTAYFCGCKRTGKAPLCDGAHSAL